MVPIFWATLYSYQAKSIMLICSFSALSWFCADTYSQTEEKNDVFFAPELARVE